MQAEQHEPYRFNRGGSYRRTGSQCGLLPYNHNPTGQFDPGDWIYPRLC